MHLPPRWLRRRWQFLAIYWIVQGLVAYFFSLVLVWIFLSDHLDTVFGWLAPFGVTAVILALQALFLMPIRRPAIAARGGWPIILSLAIGGLLIALLAVAFTLGLGHVLAAYELVGDDHAGAIVLGVLAASWLVSTVLLIAFCRRGRREQILQRVAAGVFLGTIIEAAAIIPMDALLRRREDCICGTGTFIGLAICGSVGVFVFGPAVFLPLVLRHRKRWYGGRCGACGYDMTGLHGAEKCPECGAGWRRKGTEGLRD
jgi:ribosomal protein S27AE